MDKHVNVPMDQSSNCVRSCCGKRSFVSCLIKTLLALIVLSGVFCAGLGTGARLSRMRLGFENGLRVNGAPGQMMWNRGTNEEGVFGRTMMPVVPSGNMMNRGFFRTEVSEGGTAASGTVRILGSIAKIEGNKLTITDNGAKDHVVMSQSETVILSSTGATSLASLKTGQTVDVQGVMSGDSSLSASMIRVY